MHSDFSSSALVRLLGAWMPTPVPASGLDVAERLGLWVSAFDAIKLQAAHQGLAARQGLGSPTERVRAARSLHDQLQRVRAALAHAIGQDPLAMAGIEQAQAGYAPFQRRHAELQRHMEQMLTPLREQARMHLERCGGRLLALARLDAAMQATLSAHEHQQLTTVPALLGRRFEQLRADAEPPEQALAPPGGSWLERFVLEWRRALLAELELRLEPLSGLMAALNNEHELT